MDEIGTEYAKILYIFLLESTMYQRIITDPQLLHSDFAKFHIKKFTLGTNQGAAIFTKLDQISQSKDVYKGLVI